MKVFRLSTPVERVAGISFVAVTLAAFGLLLYALRSQTGLLITCGLAILLISAMLVIYVINVMKAACIVDTANKTMEVRGLTNYTVDLSNVTLLQTLPRKGAQATIRVLVFTDAEDQVIAKVPTMFSFKSGVQAEPMAKEMAKELGIAFKQNVPEWEYNKEKYKEHAKELAQQQKKEAQERRQKRIEMRINKRKKQ